jgi:hypothetical protein
MMIGTDIRLMTPLMKELLLNEESIAINQDWLAPPGDAVKGCSGTTPAPAPPPSPAPRPASCSVSLKHQDSHHTCTLGASYGCSANDTAVMWVSDGCRGEQTNGRPAQLTTVLRPADQNCPAPTASDRGVQLQRRHHAVRRPQGAQGPALRVRGCPGASPPHPGRRERPSRRLLAASVAPPPLLAAHTAPMPTPPRAPLFQTKLQCKREKPNKPQWRRRRQVWVRHLSNGDLAVALPNLGRASAPISICLDSIGWKHGSTAKVRDVWKKKDLPAIKGGKFTATVDTHDTLLLRLSPTSAS